MKGFCVIATKYKNLLAVKEKNGEDSALISNNFDFIRVKVKELGEEAIGKIPLYAQCSYLLRLLNETGVKLTAVGNLPPKIVKEMYALGVPERLIDCGISKLRVETDSSTVQLARITLRECGLLKVRYRDMTITKKGMAVVQNPNGLLREIIKFVLCDFNTAYFDRIENQEIGNIGRLFSLWLLHLYGDEWHDGYFYAQEYFRLFTMPDCDSDIYCIRIMERLFYYLGVVELRYGTKSWLLSEVRRSALLDTLFDFVQP
jgi:hypothetical protein